MKKIFFSILVLLLNAPVIVWAEQNNRMDTVFVTASRSSASEIDTHFQTGSVSVIQVSDAGKSMATVADLLDQESSVQVRQLAGLGSYSAVSIRGSSANQVNVYLDGVLLNEAYGGSVDLSQFLLNHIEKIEVYRGGVPVQLGAAGIGGAINIITKQSDGQAGGQYELGYGSYESKKVAGLWSDHFGDHSYQAALSYLGSDNDFIFLNNQQTRDNLTDDVIERRRNAQFEQLSGMLSVLSELGQGRSLKTVLQHEKKDKHTPNIWNDDDNKATYDTDFTSIKLDLDDVLSASSSIGYQFSMSHKRSEFKDIEGTVGIAKNDERAILDSLGAQIDYAKTYGMHAVNVHAELDFQDYRIRDPLESVHQEVERQRVRFALQDEWVNRAGDLLLTARSAYEFSKDSDQLRSDVDKENAYLDGQLGAKYWVHPDWAISANVSRDIRTPRLSELFGNQGNSKGNDDLEEEYALNADVGLSYESKDLQVRAQLFYRDLDDAIVMIYDAQGTGKAQNIAEARIQGIELETDVNIGNGFGINANFTSQMSETLAGQPSSVGEPLPGIYEQAVHARVSYMFDFYRTELEFTHNSGGYFDESGVAEKPETNQFNLLNELTFDSHKVVLRVENINDEPVTHFNRFPGPGRSFFLTYTHQF